MSEIKYSGVKWLGYIPCDWKTHRLGAIGEFSGSGNDKKVNPDDKRVKMINYVDVYNNTTYELDSKREYMDVTCPYNKYDELQVKKGDLIFTPSSETIEDIGISALVTEELENTVYSYHVINYRSNKYIDFLYKKYLCNNAYCRQYFSSRAVGTVRKTLSRDDFKNLIVALPPVDTQVKIASFLDCKCSKIDEIIESKKKTNELLKERKQSIIHEAVTKGLNPDVRMKDSNVEWIERIPENWSVERLRGHFSFGKGLSITKNDLTEKGVAVISYGQIHSKDNIFSSVDKSLLRYVPEEILNDNEASLVKKGDFIFADTSEDIEGSGNFVFFNDNYQLFAGYHTIILKSIQNSDNKYLAYLFQTDAWRSQIRSSVSGVKLFSITQNILKRTMIIMPGKEEQAQITKYLDNICSEIDQIIKLNNETLEQLQEYRNSLIYEAVTGKLEIF